MSSCTLIIIDREDDDEVYKYLGKLYGMKGNLRIDLFLIVLYVLTFSFARDMYRISLDERR